MTVLDKITKIGTEFLRSLCQIGRLCIHPEEAYRKSYSDYLFAGVIIPCLTYLFFALNLGIERLSFLSSATGLKTTLLVFFGIIVGDLANSLSAHLKATHCVRLSSFEIFVRNAAVQGFDEFGLNQLE